MEKPIVIFGIDDVHPQKRAEGKDFGGNMNEGALGLLTELSGEFRGFKTTLFVTPNWIYKNQRVYARSLQRILGKVGLKGKSKLLARRFPKDTFRLDKHQEWCKFISEHIKKGVFTVELHGLYHLNDYIFYSEEFMDLPYDECNKRIKDALKIFANANLPIPTGFAFPGWYVSGALLNALKDNDLKFVAGSLDSTGIIKRGNFSNGAGLSGVSALEPQEINGILNIPRNWDIKIGTIDRAKRILEEGGILSIHAHIAEEGVQNAITPDTVENLMVLLGYIEDEYSNVRYLSFREIYERINR